MCHNSRNYFFWSYKVTHGKVDDTEEKEICRGLYPDELHYFPMTLKFYSAKAYTYVRKTFNLGFPDLSTISKWYRVISGKPGFTEEQLTALKAKVLAGKEKGQKVVCSLMLDEMSPYASMLSMMARKSWVMLILVRVSLTTRHQ